MGFGDSTHWLSDALERQRAELGLAIHDLETARRQLLVAPLDDSWRGPARNGYDAILAQFQAQSSAVCTVLSEARHHTDLAIGALAGRVG